MRWRSDLRLRGFDRSLDPGLRVRDLGFCVLDPGLSVVRGLAGRLGRFRTLSLFVDCLFYLVSFMFLFELCLMDLAPF